MFQPTTGAGLSSVLVRSTRRVQSTNCVGRLGVVPRRADHDVLVGAPVDRRVVPDDDVRGDRRARAARHAAGGRPGRGRAARRRWRGQGARSSRSRAQPTDRTCRAASRPRRCVTLAARGRSSGARSARRRCSSASRRSARSTLCPVDVPDRPAVLPDGHADSAGVLVDEVVQDVAELVPELDVRSRRVPSGASSTRSARSRPPERQQARGPAAPDEVRDGRRRRAARRSPAAGRAARCARPR